MAPRIRAGSACQNCHARKSKCDAQQNGTPCSGCRRRSLNDCRIMRSNRGQYTRKSRFRTATIQEQPEIVESNHIDPIVPPLSENEISQISNPVQPSPNIFGTTLDSLGDIIESFPVEAAPSTANGTHVSENNVSWAQMFESFLESRGRERAVEKASITYLGESFPLTTVLEDLRREGRLKLHHPGPTQAALVSSPSGTGIHPPHIAASDISYLQSKGAFVLPERSCLEVLVRAFAEKVYPFYPMVILQEFLQQYEDGTIPWVLYHAVCFAGASFCPLSALHMAGFPSRRLAVETFYNKAKLLFDFAYEKDKIVLLQSVTLLTFWPSSPSDAWTFYQWLAFGVTLAESLGLHRSMTNIDMPQKDRSLLKRIWWILVIRDAFGAALFGRPVRINGIHCDVEFTTMVDFIHDYPQETVQELEHSLRAQYFGLMSELSVNLRDITTNRFKIGLPTSEQDAARTATEKALNKWRTSVPAELDWDLVSPSDSPFAAALSMLYDNNIIFMNVQRPRPMDPDMLTPPDIPGTEPRRRAAHLPIAAHEAAERIIGVATSLATREILTSMPHEVFTGLFVAEVVLFTKSCDADTNLAKLAQAQIKCCQLLFYEVRDFWDPATWVMQLFDGLFRKEQPGTSQNHDRVTSLDDMTDQLNDWETFLGDFNGFSHMFQ